MSTRHTDALFSHPDAPRPTKPLAPADAGRFPVAVFQEPPGGPHHDEPADEPPPRRHGGARRPRR
ncbi:hypothetical protein [Saccharothrix algeriensis]|uniref:Uncharacterized protein n=1 Tax=Saccharothrix algeriensis TaxID=173560 RepID=A0ABS2S4V3_9PSEU|nr:hypothetical protein [Saccharothrix algeriensis]MBM7810338.1 hypothetical protein [Saccharothrix algeriensis]